MASNKKSYDGAHDYKQELKSGYRHSERFETDTCPTKLKLMKKNTKNVQMSAPDKSGVCATCFYKFHDKSSKTGFYCIKLHEEVLPNGSC